MHCITLIHSLHAHITRVCLFLQINLLSSVCQKGDKDKYSSTVDAIIVAAKQIREELSAMEVDILVSETMAQLLERTRQQMNSAVREVQLSALMASSKSYRHRTIISPTKYSCLYFIGSVAPESAGMKLMASAGHLKDVCSKTVRKNSGSYLLKES